MESKLPEKSGFVAGAYLPIVTPELIEKALMDGRNRSEIIVTEECLKKGVVVLVWNIKTWWKAWNYIDNHRNLIHKSDDELKVLRDFRRLNDSAYPFNGPTHGQFLKWLRTQIGDTKWDAYGLPGGNIDPYEIDDIGEKIRELFKNDQEYEESSEHYSDYAFAREWVEETGLMVIRETKSDSKVIRIPLYERVARYWEDQKPWIQDKNNKESLFEHEDYCFLVHSADGVMRETGVEGETLAPEILPIVSLNRHNFYRKHAYLLIACIERMIREYGREDLSEALAHLENTFEKCPYLRTEPRIRMPKLNIGDNLWDEYVKLNQMKKLE